MTKYLTVEQVAELIAPDGINKHMWTWRRMVDGRIPGAIRIDRTHLVIPESKLMAWLASNTIDTESEESVEEPIEVAESAVIHGLSARVAARRMARSA